MGIDGAERGPELVDEPEVFARVLAHSEQVAQKGLSLQPVLQGVRAHALFALWGARPGGLRGVATIGLRLLGGGLTFLGNSHTFLLFFL